MMPAHRTIGTLLAGILIGLLAASLAILLLHGRPGGEVVRSASTALMQSTQAILAPEASNRKPEDECVAAPVPPALNPSVDLAADDSFLRVLVKGPDDRPVDRVSFELHHTMEGRIDRIAAGSSQQPDGSHELTPSGIVGPTAPPGSTTAAGRCRSYPKGSGFWRSR